MIFISEKQTFIENGTTRLTWLREDGEWILHVYGRSGQDEWVCLAKETKESGFRAYLEGPISWRERKYRIPGPVTPVAEGEQALEWRWSQNIGGNEVKTYARFAVDNADCIRGTVTWRLDRDTIRPHFGFGVTTGHDYPVDDYSWIQSPSQAGVTDRKSRMSLWLISTYDSEGGVRKYDGCQAIYARKNSAGELITNVKLPPGYMDFDSENELKAGAPVSVRFVFTAAAGAYYENIGKVLKIQPLEPLPPRFGYRKHIDLVIDTLRDPRKWKEEGDGIISYCVVQGNPFTHTYSIARDREGPGWGGSWDLEMIYLFHQYKSMFADADTSAFIDGHTKRMLAGWIDNPRFRMGADITWREPGDMRDSFVAALMLNGPTMPHEETDVIWIGHNAYMIYYLSKIASLSGDDRYLRHAESVSDWFFRMRSEDGSVPTLWQLEEGKATATHGFQAGSCLYITSALLELFSTTGNKKYERAAIELADFAYDTVSPFLPQWGQGELDWIPKNANAIDPTGISYIIWGYADAYAHTGDERYREIVDKFCSILMCLFAFWEPHEELLRGSDKITIGSHGMDLKFAGGVACGTWSYYGSLLMNRNEIGDALLRAYEVTGNGTYKDFLIAYMHWHMYFQFTNEVPEEPVSTLGSCPQNLFWTRSYPCYNNDWGCTASKNASLMMKMLEKNIIAE